MTVPTLHEAVPPIPVTAIVTDIRNFTPHLIGSDNDEQGINRFCHFLSSFYALCLKAAIVALPAEIRSTPPLYMSSTGDGVLAIFTSERHHIHGYLTALILNRVLGGYCAAYNERRHAPGLPLTSFGIGVESGAACRVRALPQNNPLTPVVDTYIGNCINIASRVESITKTLYRANTIVSASLNERLCQEFFGESYAELEKAAARSGAGDSEQLAIYEKMEDWHRELCMTYIHHHVLKGIEEPLPLFRVSDRSARLGNPRFDQLLKRLVGGSTEHEADVRAFLENPAIQLEPTAGRR